MGGSAFDVQTGHTIAYHEQLKTSERAWSRLAFVGVQRFPAENGEREELLCMRNCTCGSTLAKSISREEADRLRHGESSTRTRPASPEHRVWTAMVSRCGNPRDTNFPRYGGRGITVCLRWRTYALFLADMGRRPSPRHTLDRADVNGNYEPGNCRWATPSQQQRNRRDARVLEIGGVIRHVAEWSDETGIDPNVIWNRLLAGWPPERAVREPCGSTLARRLP